MSHEGNTPPPEPMSTDALISRRWNGTPIARRSSDGYVNATTMCKANGKAWNDYWRLDRATEYLEALSTETGIPVSSLCLSLRGGSAQGTWVHPRVAVDLARWISAPFAVWMDGWFLESIQQGAAATVQASAAAIDPQQTLSLIERSYNLLERLGVVDERDRIQFGDMVRNVAARGAGGLLLPASADLEELAITDAWLEVTGQRLPKAKGQSIGKLLAAMFRQEVQQEPPTRLQYVDGAPRQVKSYRRGWLIEALKSIRAQLEGS